MALIDPKQIDAFFSVRVTVDYITTGGVSDDVSASLASVLTTAGRGGGAVPLRVATNKRGGVDMGPLATLIPILADDGTPLTVEDDLVDNSPVVDRFLYGQLTVDETVWTLSYYVKTVDGNKLYAIEAQTLKFLPSYSFHMGQLPNDAFVRIPQTGTGPRGLRGDDGWAVPVQRISASGPLTIDYAAGKHVELTLTGDVIVAGIENWPSDGYLARLTIDTFNPNGYSITWPSAWIWSYGSVPILSTGVGATDTFVIRTTTAGASIRADVGGMNYS